MWPLRDLHSVLSKKFQMNRAAAMRGDGTYLDLIVDWSKHSATGSILERVEAGRDVDLNLGQQCRGGQGRRKHVGESLCAEFWAGRRLGLEQACRGGQ